MPRFSRSICVFCGARPGRDPKYATQATEFGQALAQEGWRLVYGAGDQGIMGAVAQAVENAKGDLLGVIPTHLIGREFRGDMARRFIVTENMHERKKVMHMNSDAAVVLPGGAGSLDEFFEVLTWRQLGLHEHPIYLLNTNGYWSKLISLIDHVIAEGFADASLLDFVQIADDVPALLGVMRADLS